MNETERFLGRLDEVDRRRVLAGLVAIAAASAMPSTASADAIAIWPKEAFDEKVGQQDAVLKRLYGKTAEMSDKVSLDVPEIAENGAVVPVTITTSLPNVTSISILVPENPGTLIATYPLPAGTAASVSSRIKMAKTSAVIAVVETDGKLLMASKPVKVTLGGCGG